MNSIREKLTIYTVSYGHSDYLQLNLDFLKKNNQDSGSVVEWLVAENAHQNMPNRITNENWPFETYQYSLDTGLGASHHHALALNTLLENQRSRFILVLDPDLYILTPNWVNEVIDYMKQHDLAFFGVPWNPKYNENYRYFPAVHCMFIDTGQVNQNDLDFRPYLENHDIYKRIGFLESMGQAYRYRRPWDTGTRVYEKFYKSNLRSECVFPVFAIPKEHSLTGIARYYKNRLIERVLPEQYCFFPKKAESYISKGYKEMGFMDHEIPGVWDEFYWGSKPFALHVRGSFSAESRQAIEEFDLLKSTLTELIKF